jgi:hypothetical protein
MSDGGLCLYMLTKLETPYIWLKLLGIDLTCHEILLFKGVAFRLQECPTISPWRLFMSLKLFELVV